VNYIFIIAAQWDVSTKYGGCFPSGSVTKTPSWSSLPGTHHVHNVKNTRDHEIGRRKVFDFGLPTQTR